MKRKYYSLLLCCLWALFFPNFISQAFAATDAASQENTSTSDSNRPAELEEVQRGVKNAVNEMLSVTGSVLSGMSEGMRDGAKQIQEQLDGIDGIRLVANKEDLTELLKVSVLRTEKGDSGNWRITLAIKNEKDVPIRLVNLTTKQSVMLLDTEGFAHEPTPDAERKRTLTVAANTAIKATFGFTGLEGNPNLFRLFGADIPIQDPPLNPNDKKSL